MRQTSSRGSVGAALRATVIALGVAALGAGQGTTVQVGLTPEGRPVPDDFAGLSIEMQDGLGRYFGSPEQPNEVFFTLVRQLGAGTFRMGGNSQDEVCWLDTASAPRPEICKGVLSQRDYQSYATAFNRTGWPFLLGVNLGQSAPEWVRKTAKEGVLPAFPVGGLLGLEIGNEPDSFRVHRMPRNGPAMRDDSYSAADYVREFNAYREAFRGDAATAAIPFAGWATNLHAQGWRGNAFREFLAGVGPANLALATSHIYAVGGCGGKPVGLAGLVASKTLSGMEAEMKAAVATARERGLDLQITETNSVSCGGRSGISDSFAAAAWGLDWMLDLAQLGVRRINFHTVNARYAVVQSAASGETPNTIYSNEARPLYYAMHLFASARNQRFLPVAVTAGANVRFYALTACDECPVQVFAINKDRDAETTASIRFGRALGDASILTMQAPALESGVADLDYGGQRFDLRTGLLAGASVRTALSPDSQGAYTLRLRRASVSLLTIFRQPRTPAVTQVDSVRQSGRILQADGRNLAAFAQSGAPSFLLGGSRVTVDGTPALILGAEPDRLLLELPPGLSAGRHKLGVIVAALPPAAEDFEVEASGVVPQFRDGDTVVFLGDSITHSRKWHRYVMDDYLTRFPKRRIRYVNAGSSGDTATGALQRLDRDVLAFHPNVVIVMLGMNDVRRDLYAPGEASPKNRADRKAALDKYGDAMTRLAARLRAGGVRDLIFVVSSPFDDTARIETPNLPGVNNALRQCGMIVREIADRTGATVVDFNEPMTALNRSRQSNDPAFTLVGRDRVHPGEPGQLLMAHLFLRAQGMPALVSEATVDGRAAVARGCFRCRIEYMQTGANSIEFDLTASALPLPIEAGARPALEWIPIEQELAQERLCIPGLRPGTYTLRIDGQEAGRFESAALAQCVAVDSRTITPQRAQAEKVASLNEQRRQAMVALRDVAKFEDSVLGPAKLLGAAEPDQRKYVTEWLARQRARDEGQYRYYSGLGERYFKLKSEEGEIRATIERMSAALQTGNVPVTHHYKLETP